MTVDLEAANAAIRLDPGLAPPVGTTVRFADPQGWGELVTGNVSFYLHPARRRHLVFDVGVDLPCKEGDVPVRVSIGAQNYEIVELPARCPPIADWKRRW